METINDENMEQDKKRMIKHTILNYIELNLKYYVSKEDLEKERQKLFKALRDLFTNVPLAEMTDNGRFCENGRFDFLMRKCRSRWGKKFLNDIHDIIIDRLE